MISNGGRRRDSLALEFRNEIHRSRPREFNRITVHIRFGVSLTRIRTKGIVAAHESDDRRKLDSTQKELFTVIGRALTVERRG